MRFRRKIEFFRGSMIPAMAAAAATLLVSGAASAQTPHITTDGTMGDAVSFTEQHVDIPSTLGTLKSGNLFHSFGRFDVPAAHSATFTDPTASSIDNVISRVTGGSASMIDGTLASTIANSDFFFINPAGVVFGPDAQIDVPGSFHVGTADTIVFPDGQFNATNPADTVLSSAPPEAFGFLNDNPASVLVDGSFLLAPAGETLSVVAEDIDVNGAVLGGPDASVLLVGIDSPGQLAFAAPRDVSSFSALGNVTVDSSAIDVDFFPLGLGGGTIAIRGGDIVISGSSVKTSGFLFDGGDIDIAAAGELLVDASDIQTETSSFLARAGDIRLEGNSLVLTNLSVVNSSSLGFLFDGDIIVSGRTGDVILTGLESILISGVLEVGTFANQFSIGDAGNIWLSSNGVIAVSDSFIGSGTLGFGRAGDITVNAGALVLNNESLLQSVSSSPFGSRSGEIDISARETVSVDSGSAVLTSSALGDTGGISVSTQGALNIDDAFLSVLGGNVIVGAIVIDVGSLSVSGRSLIGPSNEGLAAGGDITIKALQSAEFITEELDDLVVIGSGASLTSPGGNISMTASDLVISGNVFVSADTGFNGGNQNGGTITFDVDRLVIDRGAIVSSSTVAAGNAGDIMINASESVTITGTRPDGIPTSLASVSGSDVGEPPAEGSPGSIEISAPLVTVDNGQIVANNDSGLVGGNIVINADNLVLTSTGGIQVSADGTGPGGNLDINATDSVVVTAGGAVLAGTTAAGNGGNIFITAPVLKVTGETSGITVGSFDLSETQGIPPATGDGGDMEIDVGELILVGGSIDAQTENTGAGGTITINADSTEVTSGAQITATSEGTGTAGDIIIDSGKSFFSKDSSIQTSADESDGGNITLNADSLIRLVRSAITTSVGGGEGDGGNIAIDPDFLVLDSSVIQANAFGGNGGNITIVAGQLVATPDSVIEASSALGVDGTVNISSPDTQIAGDLTVLPSSLVDVANLLAERCAAQGSSLAGVGRGGLPASPDQPLSDSYSVVLAPGQQTGSGARTDSQTARLYLRLDCGS